MNMMGNVALYIFLILLFELDHGLPPVFIEPVLYPTIAFFVLSALLIEILIEIELFRNQHEESSFGVFLSKSIRKTNKELLNPFLERKYSIKIENCSGKITYYQNYSI